MITPDEYQDACNRDYEPEGAIAILTNILRRPASRANGKSTLNMITDMAICRAIVALEKEMRSTDSVQHGKWVKYELYETYGSDDSNAWYKCSECQKGAHGWVDEDTWYSFPHLSDYCPHCGAKMDGGSDENP